MNSDNVHYLIAGILIGLLISFAGAVITLGPDTRERNILKTACEQNLPRNQECELQYVPSKVIK